MAVSIKFIAEANFRCSEVTIFEEFAKKNRAFVNTLKQSDVIVFVSKTGNQMFFAHGFTHFESANDTRTAFMHVGHRILKGSWNPECLRNYLEAEGLEVHGLLRFEEHYKHLTHGSHTPVRKTA